eukprot:3776692-Amphidinium_carterae.4
MLAASICQSSDAGGTEPECNPRHNMLHQSYVPSYTKRNLYLWWPASPWGCRPRCNLLQWANHAPSCPLDASSQRDSRSAAPHSLHAISCIKPVKCTLYTSNNCKRLPRLPPLRLANPACAAHIVPRAPILAAPTCVCKACCRAFVGEALGESQFLERRVVVNYDLLRQELHLYAGPLRHDSQVLMPLLHLARLGVAVMLTHASKHQAAPMSLHMHCGANPSMTCPLPSGSTCSRSFGGTCLNFSNFCAHKCALLHCVLRSSVRPLDNHGTINIEGACPTELATGWHA